MDDNLERDLYRSPQGDLERAIIRVDTERLMELWDVTDRDLYRCLLLVNIDNLWIKMNGRLFQHLSQVFITHEYTEIYNKILLVNSFHEAVAARDFLAISITYPTLIRTGIEENILLNILADNLDTILDSKMLPLISLMATYFCNGPYHEEYEKICKTITPFLQ